jgi:MFS family permease
MLDEWIAESRRAPGTHHISMRARPTPATITTAAAVDDWRAFSARRYRSFRVLAVAQGLIGSLTGPGIVIPLLLALGAHPALATALAVLPVLGTMSQRVIPPLLDRTDGNLRGVVILFAAIGEPRGLLLAAVVAGAAAGWLGNGVAIGLVALIVGTFGSLGAIGYALLQSWYQIVLAEDERRVVTPRLGAISLGIGSVVLFPLAIVMDGLVDAIGTFAYVGPLAIAGVAGVLATIAMRRLPSPGRVRVPRQADWVDRRSSRLRRHGDVMTLASVAAGLNPFLTVYAITVLGSGPGFAIAISAVSSATLVLASLAFSTYLRGGSSSRLLRRSFLLRSAALLAGLAAHPANPWAAAVVLVVAALLAIGDAAGQLSANERLMRLATGPDVIAFQSHYVVRNVAGYAGGVLSGSGVLLLGGYPAFAILFVAAGVTRFVAASRTDVSAAPSATAAAEP